MAKKKDTFKRFFNENDDFTAEAGEFDREIMLLISPLFTKWMRLGYSPRDIATMIGNVAYSEGIHMVVRKRMEKIRKGKDPK